MSTASELARLLPEDALAWAQRIRQRALPEHITRLLRRRALWPPSIRRLPLGDWRHLPLASAEPLTDLARLLPGERPPLERELTLARTPLAALTGLGEELAAEGEPALGEAAAGITALRQRVEGAASSTMERVRQALQRAEGATSLRPTELASTARRAVERARQAAGQITQLPRGAGLVEELPAALRPLAQTVQGAVERAQEAAAELPSLGEALPERLASLAGEAAPERLTALAREALPEQAAPLVGAAREALGEAATLPEAAREALASAERRVPGGGLASALRAITAPGLRARAGALLQRATEALGRRLPGGASELWRRFRGELPTPPGPEAPALPGASALGQALAERAPAPLAEALTRAVGAAPAEAEAPLAGVTEVLERGRALAAPLAGEAQAAIQGVAERVQGAAERLAPQGVVPRALEAARGLFPRAREALARWLAPREGRPLPQAEARPPVPPQGQPLAPPEGAPGAPPEAPAQPPLREPWQGLAARGAEILGLGVEEAPPAEEAAQAPGEEFAASPAEEAWPLQRIPLGEALFGREAGAPGPAEAGELASTLAAPLAERAAPGLRRVMPALQVGLVRRGAEGAPRRETAEEAGEAPSPGPAGGGGLDLDELAEQVYRRIRERLRVERERSGPLR